MQNCCSNQDETTQHEIYEQLNVEASSRIQISQLKRWSWRGHGQLLSILHWGDDATPPDVYVNLRVLWNKAITSLDPKSPANESDVGYITYHLLPKVSRTILLKWIPIRWYPRWFHANIELRTVFLDQAVQSELQYIHESYPDHLIRLVILGGGYDARPLRLLVKNDRSNDQDRANIPISSIWELDLPQVVKSKALLLDRLYKERPDLKRYKDILKLEGVDLNATEEVKTTFGRIMDHHGADQGRKVYTIVIAEAVLMYLKDDVPEKIWNLCRNKFGPTRTSFAFVDRITTMIQRRNADDSSITAEQPSNKDKPKLVIDGWDVVSWAIKPGATKHMGLARGRIDKE